MNVLSDILYKVPLQSVAGNMDTMITGVQFDSREIREGNLFVAVAGTQADGHRYIGDAVSKGARVVVYETAPEGTLPDDVVAVQVKDSAKSLGVIASNFFGNPSGRLHLVGVTGTNGKTTVVSLLHQLFMKLGCNTGLLSTIENKLNSEVYPARLTTPDPLEINRMLRRFLDEGCTHCFMEVSSHAVVQERVAGLEFSGGIFTNISHDHLDYHKTFENYINAKKKFFDELPSEAFALVNADDKQGKVMLQNTRADKKTYALKAPADFKAKIVSNTLQGIELDIGGKDVWFRLSGSFNAYNLLAAYAGGSLLGEEPDFVLTELSGLAPARGRFEKIISQDGVIAVIDYAHSPGALENVLETVEELKQKESRVITVVGCGGNRDRQKRPEMARIAAKFSDKVVLTSDNPRYEDPESIIKEMQTGIGSKANTRVMSVADRREAIKTACNMAMPGDVVLVAGKGHETYQEVAGKRHSFDDKEVVKEIFGIMESGN